MFNLIYILKKKPEVVAVAFQKISQGGMGFLTSLLIATLINIEYQGYYFTLVNFAAAFTLLDLGLSGLLVQISASLFAKSKMNNLDFTNSSLSNNFGEFIIWTRKYFLKLSILYILILPIAYLYFVKSTPNLSDNFWLGPLCMTIFSVALSIPAYAFLSIIEGIGRVKAAYSLRIVIIFLGGLAGLYCIFNNQPLYAPSMIPLAMSLVVYYWAFTNYKNLLFYKEINSQHSEENWKSSLLTLRNKVKLTTIATFLFQSGPTLIIFYYLGPVPAGQIGISISFLGMIAFISNSFFIAKIPELTRLVSLNNHIASRELFIHEFKRAVGFTLIGYFVWMTLIYLMHEIHHISERFLSPYDMLLLIMNFIIIQLVTLLNAHSRSQGFEVMAHPFFNATIFSTAFFIIFNSHLSVTNLLLSMNIAYLLFCVLPIIKYLLRLKFTISTHNE